MAMITGIEKIGLAKELASIRASFFTGDLSGSSKLSNARRILEIRKLLSVKVGNAGFSIDKTAPLSDKFKAITNYINSGFNDLPEALKPAEAETLNRIRGLLDSRGGGDESAKIEAHEAYRIVSKLLNNSKESFIATLEHFKGMAQIPDVNVDEIKAIQSRIEQVRNEDVSDSPEVAAKIKEVEDTVRSHQDEYHEITRERVKGGLSAEQYEALGDKQADLYELIVQYNGQLRALYQEKRIAREKRVAEVRQELAEIGKHIIAPLLSASSVTQEQADSWAKNQVIDKSARAKLAKQGYPEADIRRDMAEFYRITGGKLRDVAIVTDGSRRANAGNIGHFEFNEIRPGSRFDKEVLWHEMAHHLEANPAAVIAANGFLNKRRESEKVYSLRSLTGNKGYGLREIAYKDGFINPYIGKVYRDGLTEVFSMGVQYLSNPEQAASFIANDPEMASLVIGYLKSELTPAMKVLQSLQDGAADENQARRDDAENEYQRSVSELSNGIGIVDDGWFGKLDDQSQYGILIYCLRDKNAKFIGSYGDYRVFSGKFKNKKTRRIAKGFAVIQESQNDHLNSFPGASFFHGDIQEMKAAIRISMTKSMTLSSVEWNFFSGRDADKPRVIDVFKNMEGSLS